MLWWKFGGWILLLSHFFFPSPYREQILAVQTVLISFSHQLMPFHMATGIITSMFIFGMTTTETDVLPTLLHHVAVFISLISEFHFKEWRWTCWIFLCWSLRWIHPSNVYSDHPLKAFFRCVVFGFVTQRNFSFETSIRWCWTFMVHEGFCILIPIQMLYSVYIVQKVKRVQTDIV